MGPTFWRTGPKTLIGLQTKTYGKRYFEVNNFDDEEKEEIEGINVKEN